MSNHVRDLCLCCGLTTVLMVSVAATSVVNESQTRTQPQGINEAGGESAQEIVLSPYAGSLRTMKARCGGKDRTFLFDTGGGASILSAKVATELGRKQFGRATAFRHDGGRMDVPRVGPMDLTVGSFTRTGEFGVLNLDELLMGLPPIDGILSLETFEGRIITLDLGADRLWIETPESAAARTKDAKELTARMSRPAGGAGLDIFVAIHATNGPMWFELDSGSVAPVLIAPHAAAELGIQDLNQTTPQQVNLNIDGLGIVPCEAQRKEMIYDGLLNAAFCADHAITFDLANGRVWAKSVVQEKR
ncbi:MAG: retropepsin-like domain-containing protein [Phycisphaeraceae bacterium]|nr:retropepsin-like domain-containing protein [Phycisphaeraceae bacterium]